MQKILKSTLIAGAAAAVLLGAVGVQAEALKLRLSVESTPGASTQFMLASFRDALVEVFGDDVEVEFFDSAVLGDEIVHMEQVRAGQIDVIPIGSDAVQLDSKWAVFDMPFLFADRETVSAILDGEIGDELGASMREKVGLQVVGFGEIGFRHITNNVRPVVTPDDLKGLKLRTPGSKTRILAFKALGATPIAMNIGELYLAMQQGVIDGQENPLGNIRAWSWFEVQKYISLSNHVYTPITLVMNGARYDSLTDEQKAKVNQAGQMAAEASRQFGAENDVKLVAEIKGLPSNIAEFNDIDVASFQAAAGPIWTEISKVAGEDFTAKVLAALGL